MAYCGCWKGLEAYVCAADSLTVLADILSPVIFFIRKVSDQGS